MAQPLTRKNVWVRQADLKRRVRREERKPNLPGPYIYVSGGTGGTAPVETWQSPPWQNSFTWAGTSYFGFRHGLDGETEFVGTLDLTSGAVTDTVAFQLPVPFRNVFDPRKFPIDLGGGLWTFGILRMVQTAGPSFGNVIIDWPVQATPI